MPINTKSEYIELGSDFDFQTEELFNILVLPAPNSLTFNNNHIEDAGRNDNTGEMLMKQVGRTMYKQSMSFDRLTNDKFWETNRWLDKYGYQFYVRYFNHAMGQILIHRFYSGTMSECEPSEQQVYRPEILMNVPKFYKKVTITMIDTGNKDVYLENEVAL